VFAVNDVMAVGATAALRDQGYRLPEDMAVAGFDDISTLRDVRPSLTTVRLPLIAMGRRALELALDGRKVAASQGDPDGDDTGQDAAVIVEVSGEVVVRDSTPARTPNR